MTTYYFGDMEYGDFVKGDEYYPVVLIDNVRDVRDFESDALAESHMIMNGYMGYIETNPKNTMIYFRKP